VNHWALTRLVCYGQVDTSVPAVRTDRPTLENLPIFVRQTHHDPFKQGGATLKLAAGSSRVGHPVVEEMVHQD
jgi:hypothetical protein